MAMWNELPISVTRQWKTWAKVNGPIGGLREDYLAADIAYRTAAWTVDEDDRHVTTFLPPWRRPGDYAAWIDFEEWAEPERLEFSAD